VFLSAVVWTYWLWFFWRGEDIIAVIILSVGNYGNVLKPGGVDSGHRRAAPSGAATDRGCQRPPTVAGAKSTGARVALSGVDDGEPWPTADRPSKRLSPGPGHEPAPGSTLISRCH
jgi:hypothetical protein